MRVVVGERLGGPEVLAVAEREAPRPGPGEIVVDVAAAGVNFMDIYQREGIGNYRPEPPFVPGAEGAGARAAATPSRSRCPPRPSCRFPTASACRSPRPPSSRA